MSSDTHAATLRAAFQEETERYEQALRIAERLPTAIQQGQDTQAQLQEMLEHLMQIGCIEQQIAETKLRWLQSQPLPVQAEHPEGTLEAQRTRLITLIHELQERLGRTEREASLQQRRLLLQLDALLLGQRMQRAYGAVVIRATGPDGD